MTDDPTTIAPEDEEVVADGEDLVEEGKTDAPSEAQPIDDE